MLKRPISIFLVITFCFGAGLVYAFDATQLQTFKSTKTCNDCDLSFANLNRVVLFQSKIANSNLSFAMLVNCDLGYAYALNANFYGANIVQSKLLNANLQGANLSGANLFKSYLAGAILVGANLSNANLNGATLTNANLTGANLTGANLSGATWVDGVICRTPSIGTCVK